LGTIAQLCHFVWQESGKKKTEVFYDWATTGIAVITKNVLKIGQTTYFLFKAV
jgi:hypothetical protein